MKVREIIKLIEADGWYLAITRGSHRQYKHPTKAGLVTYRGKGKRGKGKGEALPPLFSFPLSPSQIGNSSRQIIR
jgi:predicted RNA binding protein YcfA (HicA-like mRNA interferase family)